MQLRALYATLCFAFLLALAAGCARQREAPLVAPRVLTSPYDASHAEVIWAVAPLRNESGVSVVDLGAASDHLVAAIEEVRGIRCLPLNRTLAVMSALNMPALRSAADARNLAQALGADAIVVGSITAYDPYTPVLGMSLSLYTRPGSPLSHESRFDPKALKSSPTDPGPKPALAGETPIGVVSVSLDAKNHSVLMDLRAYAEGRTTSPSALGWRRYLASIDLYTQFAAFHSVDALLQQEWTRGSQAAMDPQRRRRNVPQTEVSDGNDRNP